MPTPTVTVRLYKTDQLNEAGLVHTAKLPAEMFPTPPPLLLLGMQIYRYIPAEDNTVWAYEETWGTALASVRATGDGGALITNPVHEGGRGEGPCYHCGLRRAYWPVVQACPAVT